MLSKVVSRSLAGRSVSSSVAVRGVLLVASSRSAVASTQSFSTLVRSSQPCRRAANLISSSTRQFSTKLPDHIVLTMPALSPTMERGNLASWKIAEGGRVKAGAVIADVETDKATVAFESVEEGYLAKILVPSGTNDVALGTAVAILVENEADCAAFKNYEGTAAKAAPAPAAAAAPAPAAAAPAATALAAAAPSSNAGGRVIASPAARRLANESGVSLNGVTGTGPNSRVVAADVKDAMASGSAVASKPAAAAAVAPAVGDFIDVPHTQIRRIIASRLSQSKQTIPHYYLSVDVNVDTINKLRAELNKKLGDSGKLSVNDFIIKASALACKQVPALNSSWMDNAIRQYNYVDVSVAVSTDSGLVTPIVKDADIKGLASISGDVKALAAKARANKLQPHEFQGGTFTISNLGMFGVKQFNAIINPPQAAILAVGGTTAVVQPNPAYAKDSSVSPYITAQVMNVTLSCDHRVVDGAVGAQWLQAFKSFLESPNTMLL